MDGLGSYSPSQPSPVQNGSDEATADVIKHVPESHWPLNARQTISNWGRALTVVQREGTRSVTRLLEVEGREGRVGPRRGAGLALRARKRKGSRLEHLAGGGACLENVGTRTTAGPWRAEIKSSVWDTGKRRISFNWLDP